MSPSVGILGVGMFVPEQVRTNDWWPASFRERFEERSRSDVTTPEVFLAKATTPEQRVQCELMLESYHDPFRGSRERRVAPDGMTTSQMDVVAARQACARAGVDPSDLDLILCASLPQDVCLPHNGGILQAELRAKRAQAVMVDTACASFLSGLAVADAMIRAGQARYALVVCSSMLTRLTDYEDPASVNFGDGAGAAVVGPVASDFGFEAHASRTLGDLHSGVCVAPKHEERWYQTGGPFFLHSKNVSNGRSIVMRSADIARQAVETVLRKARRERSEISSFYAHQPMDFFVEACRRASGLGHAGTTQTFREYASVGAANIPINLAHAEAAGQLRQGDLVLLYACGGGFTWAATVLRWSADSA